VSGALLCLGLAGTLANAFAPTFPLWPGTAATWLAGVILFFFLGAAQRRIVVILSSLSIAAWAYVWYRGYSGDISRAFSINQALVALLIGVNFLQLVAAPQKRADEPLPMGTKAFIRTYTGVLFFSSVINLSAVMLVGDRLSKQIALNENQQKLLTRAFSSAANWSPFFAAFGAATVFTPGANFSIIICCGLLISAIAFLFTLGELKAGGGQALKNFSGYPMHFGVLWLPIILSLLVLLAQMLFPSVKIILLIALFSVLTSLIVLATRQGTHTATYTVQRHILNRLPEMRGELLLFLVAGLFGTGLATLITGMGIDFPIATFDGFVACGILLFMVTMSLVGVHPVIGIAVIGPWLAPLQPDQTLLAMTFLMAWALSVSLSPVSGLALALQGRYKLSPVVMLRMNLPYAIKVYATCCILLLLIDAIA